MPRPVGIPAFLLAMAIAVIVGWASERSAVRMDGRHLQGFAEGRAPLKFLSLTLQRAAFANARMLPVYGSSELYCCADPYRPTQLFARQPTGFDAFAIGEPGVGNLLFAETFGALGHALAGRKLVLVESPAWFWNPPEVVARSYAHNLSPATADAFIFGAPVSLGLREAIARRMLAHPDTLADRPLLRTAVQALADPTPLHLAAYFALVPLGRLDAWIEQVRDARQTLRLVHHQHLPSPADAGPRPARLDWVALARRATKIAQHRDSSNPFGFPDRFYRRLLHKGQLGDALALYRAGTTNRDGRVYPPPTEWEAALLHSTEWTDLQLAAAVLRELGARPLVISIPMPGYYDDYTPLSAPERQAYYRRWSEALEQTGDPWLDFHGQDEDPYFLTDTGAHFSPRGFVFADRALDMFWHGSSIRAIRTALDALAREAPSPSEAIAWRAAAPTAAGRRTRG